jgi:hypothetical protein
MKFVKVKGFEKKVAFLGVFYMCVFGESNLTVYNKCLEDLFQQKLNNLPGGDRNEIQIQSVIFRHFILFRRGIR